MLKARYSVTEINNYIKNLISEDFILSNVCIEGEIVEYIIKKDNLVFFTIKDKQASLNGIYFNTKEVFNIGQSVSIFGRIDFYVKSGKISFIARFIKSIGEGQIYKEFLKLKEKLTKEGLFEKKKALPTKINNIAIITSKTGAVIHDFISVAKKRMAKVKIYIFEAQMQGVGSDSSIIKQLSIINKKKELFDAVVIARGGGSQEDLKTYNSEILARAIVECPIYTVSAVGHETDYCLCDFAADERAGTPSIAGQILIEDHKSDIYLLFNYVKRMFDAIIDKYKQKIIELKYMQKELLYLSQNILSNGINELMFFQEKISNQMNNILAKKYNYLQNLINRLNILNPLNLFDIGYAKIYKDNKQVLDIKEIDKNDFIKIFIKNGIIESTVTKKTEVNYES